MPNESTASARDPQLEIGHVLAMDIVGYSKLLIHAQSEMQQRLNEIVRATDQFRAADAQEKLIRLPTGDGMALVFFNDPKAPIECATEIAMAVKNHPDIQLRIGIHSGPVNQVLDVNERTNVAGAGIDIAQRVMDCGDAGHILLSKRVADDLSPYSRWNPHLHELGECEVKHGRKLSLVNFYNDEVGNREPPEKCRVGKEKSDAEKPTAKGGPVFLRKRLLVGAAILAAAIFIGLFIFFRQHQNRSVSSGVQPGAHADSKSVAVLPFENRSEDKANAYFADGVQDEILTRLSKIADLKVISRTSTQHYKSAPENLPEIAKQLGVAHIVEGSVQKSGDAVRVNVQLIKAANDSHLWAETFDRKLTDIFSVETEVAKAIADQLQAKLTGREKQVIAAKPTDNSEAYDAYLRGVDYNSRTALSPENSMQAQKYLRQAVRLDPKFAFAWALLSYVDAGGYITTFLQPTEALREETLRAAETALALNPDLGEALLAKAFYHYACFKDYDTAERYLEQARQLLPNSSRVPELLAFIARRRGQWDRSEKYFIEAERLDPRNPGLLAQHAFSYIHLRQFPEALRKLDAILDITPDDLDAVAAKGAIAQVEGDLSRASALLAPLHPPATKTLAIERQIYQAILERRPSSVIPRLKEILANPDPLMGYFNGELRFWLGWAQQIAGEHAAAQESWKQARSELEAFLKEQPDNQFLMGDLAFVYMGLGEKAAAFALVDRSLAFPSFQKDALAAARSLEMLARVAAGTGEPDRALPAIEKLLATPLSGQIARAMPFTPALLRLDPMFDSLRNDPRFQKLAAGDVSPK